MILEEQIRYLYLEMLQGQQYQSYPSCETNLQKYDMRFRTFFAKLTKGDPLQPCVKGVHHPAPS